jgi:hypothetical protein
MMGHCKVLFGGKSTRPIQQMSKVPHKATPTSTDGPRIWSVTYVENERSSALFAPKSNHTPPKETKQQESVSVRQRVPSRFEPGYIVTGYGSIGTNQTESGYIM